MEPPSPISSWVNPFPSRFINRTACFPRKVSYFRESRMSPWKNKLWVGWSRTQKPVLRPFSFFTIRSFLRFYSCWDLGRLRLSMKRWDKGSELRITERLSSRVFFFFFVVIHSTCKHAPRKESTIKRSVDDLELFDDQRWKSARITWFLSSLWSGFRPVNMSTCTKRWPK